MQFSKIMFLSDPLRHKSGQDGNADMFFGLLSGPIKRATNLESKLLDRDELAYLQKSIYKSYGFDIDNVDIKPSIFGGVPTEMWKALCFVEPNKETLEIVKFFFNDSFVVCREPSILIKKSLNILNIPFIEFAIHSVRFLDDLVLAATSNEESIYKKLLNYELDREEFFFHADLLKAESYRKNSFYANSINKPAAIFFAQTPVDRSLLDYRNRRLVSFFDYKDKFEQLTKEYEIVYYKSHPHYKNQEILNFLKKYPNVKIYDDKINTYMLLALPNIKKCVAISSGTINEAKYFGKECESWLDQPYHYSDEVCDKSKLNPVMYYITLNQQYMSSKFWADILSDFVQTNDISNVCCGGVNRFRRIIGTSWSFNDNNSCTIDSYISNSFLNINNLKGQISKINAKLDAASESEKKVLSILQTNKTQGLISSKSSENPHYKQKNNNLQFTKKIFLFGKFSLLSTLNFENLSIIKFCGIPVCKIKRDIIPIKSKNSLTKKTQTFFKNCLSLKRYFINRKAQLLILDNYEPSFLKAGFRVNEFNWLLKSNPDVRLLTFSNDVLKVTDWEYRSSTKDIKWNMPMSLNAFEENKISYLKKFPLIQSDQIQYMENVKYSAKGCYLMFIYNAYLSLPFLEKNKIPFVFTLFPGGGLRLEHDFSDHMLKKVFSSPMFKGVFVPQRIIYDYLIKKKLCVKEKIYFSYGGGFFQFQKSDILEKHWYLKNKSTFDICFVAYRYMPKGLDKGFDLFLAAAKIIIAKYPFVHFYSIGTHDFDGFNESEWSAVRKNIHINGPKGADFFPSFYQNMDAVLSPNRPNMLDKGAFDGFPLSIEGMFFGVPLFCTDELKINCNYKDGKELVIIKPNVDDIVAKLEFYIKNQDKLHEIGRLGQLKIQKYFNIDYQKEERAKFIEKYLGIKIEN